MPHNKRAASICQSILVDTIDFCLDLAEQGKSISAASHETPTQEFEGTHWHSIFIFVFPCYTDFDIYYMVTHVNEGKNHSRNKGARKQPKTNK